KASLLMGAGVIARGRAVSCRARVRGEPRCGVSALRLAAAIVCTSISLVHSATPAVSAGRSHSIALGTDGVVRTWGNDAFGQLGVGRSLNSATPLAVPGASGIIAVA